MNDSDNRVITASDYVSDLADMPITDRFRGVGTQEFTDWKGSFRQWLLDLFKEYHYSEDCQVEDWGAVDEGEWFGVTRTEVRYRNPDYGLWVPATILTPPKHLNRGAGIVCQHGHGDFGRAAVIGDRSRPEIVREIAQHRYDFGLRLAQAGYTIIAIDLLGFGARTQPRDRSPRRDPCDMLGLFMLLYGRNLVVEQVSDIQRAITLLGDWPGVDRQRIGMAGLSQGGRMTMFTTAVDPRIRAAVVSGSHNTFRDRVAGEKGLCGAQIVPGIMPRADTPDILSSIAPRPLQLQWGLEDSLIIAEPAEEGIAQIRYCYEQAGAEERFSVDKFQGGHVFDLQPALDWFDRWL